MTSIIETITDELDEILSDPDIDITTAVSRIPDIFGQSAKATYFGLRSLGLTGQQCMQAMSLEEGTLQYWQKSDPNFKDFERRALPLLQKNASVQILRLAFLRNMTVFVMQDWKILGRLAQYGPDVLTEREYNYVRGVRKHYTPSDLLAIEKAVDPDKHAGKVEINLTWGNGSTIIDGDAREVPEGDYYELGDGSRE